MRLYLMGSLRNPRIPELGRRIRELGYDVFDDWFGTGPRADDHWQEYEVERGRTYEEALYGLAAENTFNFDQRNLDFSDGGVLVLPAGRSAHLELGYLIGQKKFGYVLFDQVPERWDIMYQLANRVFFNEADLLTMLIRRLIQK